MKRYRTPSLSSNTPTDEREKLVRALSAIPGVERAILHPVENEFEIQHTEKQLPKYEAIEAAAEKAGFKLVPVTPPP